MKRLAGVVGVAALICAIGLLVFPLTGCGGGGGGGGGTPNNWDEMIWDTGIWQ